MNRRALFKGFAATAAGLLVPEPVRAYSFLWPRPERNYLDNWGRVLLVGRRNDEGDAAYRGRLARALMLPRTHAATAALSDGKKPRELAEQLTGPEADYLIEFLALAFDAWGRDAAYAPLWGKLNLTLCMWIFRTSVANLAFKPHPDKMPRAVFLAALRGLKEAGYLDWLRGRILNERDRGPAYGRIKKLMLAAARRAGPARTMPIPEWA